MTILIVDDNPQLRALIRKLVEAKGHPTIEAADGAEALRLLTRDGGTPPADLILLDLHMPVMDGSKFRHHQLEDPGLAHIPTIVMTAFPEWGRKLEMPVLTKPFVPADLFALIDQIAGNIDP